ncbi:MAG TPA: TSUP family transporter [Terriglobia bacterium]|nr:TSUP family transporter [Terriglobia bacterium]
MRSLVGSTALGLVAGLLSGLVGVGGGIIIVPALVYFFHMDQKTAQGTSLAVLLPPTGLLAFLEYYRAGHVDVKIGAAVVLGLLLGGWVGGSFAQQLSHVTLRKIFALLLFLTAIRMWTEK